MGWESQNTNKVLNIYGFKKSNAKANIISIFEKKFMSLAGRNLRYLRKLKKWTQEELAQRLNVKRSLIGAYEEERADPKLEVVSLTAELFNVTLEEILTEDLSIEKTMSFLEQRRKLKFAGSSVFIQFVPLKASAGYLKGYSDPEFLDELNTFTLPMLAPGEYRAFEIVGDSMLPVTSGSVIVGEKVENIDYIKTSNTYVLLSKSEGVVYKRVLRNNKSMEKITLMSDNPIYEPYSLPCDEILEIWRAVYILQKANNIQRWEMNQLVGAVNNLKEEVTNLKKKIN